MKLQISLDDRLAEKMDKYAHANYMTRSGLIGVALNQYLNQFELIEMVKEMALAVKLISERQDVDGEALEKIKDLDRLCSLLVSR